MVNIESDKNNGNKGRKEDYYDMERMHKRYLMCHKNIPGNNKYFAATVPCSPWKNVAS